MATTRFRSLTIPDKTEQELVVMIPNDIVPNPLPSPPESAGLRGSAGTLVFPRTPATRATPAVTLSPLRPLSPLSPVAPYSRRLVHLTPPAPSTPQSPPSSAGGLIGATKSGDAQQSLHAQYYAIQPPVGESHIAIIERGMLYHSVDSKRIYSAHLSHSDHINYTFMRTMRQVWLTILYLTHNEPVLLSSDPSSLAYEDRVYTLLQAFRAGEAHYYDFWLHLPNNPVRSKNPPSKLTKLFTGFKRAIMQPTHTDEALAYSNWPFFTAAHLDQPARKWCEDRFPGLLINGKIVPWRIFCRAMNLGFGGRRFLGEGFGEGGNPAGQAPERVAVAEGSGSMSAKKMAERTLDPKYWSMQERHHHATI